MKLHQCVLLLILLSMLTRPVRLKETKTSPKNFKPWQTCSADSCCAQVDTWSTLFMQQTQDTEEQLESLTQDLETIGPNLDSVKATTQPQGDATKQVTEAETFTCGPTKGWRRVVYLNMTDRSTACPSGWRETGLLIRTCGRKSTTSLACDSVIFPGTGEEYSSVCGRIKAYQFISPDAFEAYHEGLVTNIDGAYVTGISVTHGASPRQHIWTFASGISEVEHDRVDVCPCDANITINVPPFVGDDYFCESGNNAARAGMFFHYDPLWDGQNCISSSKCCSFNTPPYFIKQLPSSTTDDIEVRLCRMDGADDSPIELIELYVQ